MSRTIRNLILMLAIALGLGGHAFASSIATIEVKGSEQPGDASSITISFTDNNGNPYSQTIGYGQFSTQASVASTMGAMFANTYVPGGKLSAQVFCGTNNIVLFKLKGSAAFGNLTVTGSTTSFQLASSGFANSVARTNASITWPTPAAITYGTALSGAQLNATTTVAGVFAYFPGPGTVLDAGTQTLSVTFTPTDITDYAPVTATVQLVVNPAQSGQHTPVLSWLTPAAISYGTALSSTQLNATASFNGTIVPGTFEYTPGAGEVLDTGTQTLLVTFFPTDSVDYSPAGSNVSLVVNPSSLQSLTIYSYSIAAPGGGSGYAPNGNLQNYTDSVMGTWSFTYDSLNRLSFATGPSTTGTTQYTCWSYDSFGNRTDQQVTSLAGFSNSAGAPCQPASGANPVSNQWAHYTIDGTSNTVDNGKNQITGAPGVIYQYDAESSNAGNITNDGIHQYLYDGEGRICAVGLSGSTSGTQYIYDAEGARVAKGTITSWSCNNAINPSTGQPYNGFTATSSYVLGPSNEQLTETDGNGNWMHTNVYAAGGIVATYDTSPTGDPALHFQVEDWLGTRRVQTDISGNTEETYTSLPFGDGFAENVPSGAPPTADDATEHHFTGKERDTESGNDYFGARYFASSMGRMLSPDPGNISAIFHMDDPQSWNGYAYAHNNPLRFTDPTGDTYQVCDSNGQNCSNLDDKTFETDQAKDQANGEYFQNGSMFHIDGDGNHVTDGTYNQTDVDQPGDAGANIAAMGQIARDGNGAINMMVTNIATTVATAGIGEAVGPAISGYIQASKLSMLKPLVTNPKLAEVVEELFQATDKVPGGTAGAVRFESESGIMLSPAGHAEDAQNIVNQLNNMLKNPNTSWSSNDQAVAKELIRDLQNSLSGK